MELVPAGEQSPFALLRMEPDDATEMVREALGSEALRVSDLERVKVPSGGGTTWEINTLDGEVSTKELEGVIVQRTTQRAYWPYPLEDRPDDDDGRPVCRSFDGELGIGEPGGGCAECPYNEFGTDIKGGPGKACKETRQLFILTKNEILPIVLNVPPGSLANVKTYFIRLLRAQLSPTDVVTKVTLEKAKSKSNITFAKVTFKAGERLDPAARDRVKQYAALMAPAMNQAAERDISRDDLEN